MNILSEGDLKKEIKNLSESRDIECLVDYIKYRYIHDIYICFHMAMQIVKHLKSTHDTVAIIDLDKTFVQNASFAPHILEIWNVTMKRHFLKLSEQDIGPVLPFMYILYKYLDLKGVEVVFLTGRKQNLRKLTKRNLQMFGINKYKLYMCPLNENSYIFKKRVYYTLNRLKNVVFVLNDQDEIESSKIIKFPQLYKVDG